MKKRNLIIHSVAILAMAFGFAACATTTKHKSTGEYIDDSVITTKVKTRLAADDFFKSFQISVDTYQGIVQLGGFVDSKKTVDKAVEIVKGVDGVRSIKNNLIVK